MIVEDYVENGATQVKSPPISGSAPSGPVALLPQELNYQFPQSEDRLNGKRLKRL